MHDYTATDNTKDVNRASVVVVGASGTIVSSFDHVKSIARVFSLDDSTTSENLSGVAVSHDTDGWAVGQNGTILRRSGLDWAGQRPSWLQTLWRNHYSYITAAIVALMIGTVLFVLIDVRFRGDWERLAKRELEVKAQIATVQAQIENVRADVNFTNFESSKSILDDAAFTTNLGREFRLVSLEVEEARFFSAFSWDFSPNFNILLGRNGYGKSYILHAIVALMLADYEAMAEMFPGDAGGQQLGLDVKYQNVD